MIELSGDGVAGLILKFILVAPQVLRELAAKKDDLIVGAVFKHPLNGDDLVVAEPLRGAGLGRSRSVEARGAGSLHGRRSGKGKCGNRSQSGKTKIGAAGHDFLSRLSFQ